MVGFPYIVDRNSLKAINKYSHNLTSLFVGQDIFKNLTPADYSISHNATASGDHRAPVHGKDYILMCPKLRRLGLHGLTCDLEDYGRAVKDIICLCIEPMTSHLTWLDLSNCECVFQELYEVGLLSKLNGLVLFNMDLGDLRPAFSIIARLNKLRYV